MLRFPIETCGNEQVGGSAISSPSLVILSPSLCHSEGAKRLKNLAQDRFREELQEAQDKLRETFC